jgi:hypothetical protein
MNDFDAYDFDEVNGIMRSSDAEPTHTKISLSKAQMQEFSLSQNLSLVPRVRAEVVTFICCLGNCREVSDTQFPSSFGIPVGIPPGVVP